MKLDDWQFLILAIGMAMAACGGLIYSLSIFNKWKLAVGLSISAIGTALAVIAMFWASPLLTGIVMVLLIAVTAFMLRYGRLPKP